MDTAEILGILTGLGGTFATIVTWLHKSIKKKIATLQVHNEACDQKNKRLEERMMLLEADTDSGFPSWKKDFKGRWVSANGEFVRMFLAPFNKNFADIQDLTNSEISFFPPLLIDALNQLDDTVVKRGYGTLHGVRFHERSPKSTIIKKAITTKGSPVVYYSGQACPEY